MVLILKQSDEWSQLAEFSLATYYFWVLCFLGSLIWSPPYLNWAWCQHNMLNNNNSCWKNDDNCIFSNKAVSNSNRTVPAHYLQKAQVPWNQFYNSFELHGTVISVGNLLATYIQYIYCSHKVSLKFECNLVRQLTYRKTIKRSKLIHHKNAFI